MNDLLAMLVESRMPLDGIAAWGIRHGDGSIMHHSYAMWLSASQIEQTVARLALAADSLRYHELRPRRLCWVFAHLRLYVALREDSAALVLFAENRTDQLLSQTQAVLDEFSLGAAN